MAYAERLWSFIEENAAAGRTIRCVNYLTDLRIAPRDVREGAVRLRGDHVEVRRGKGRWDSINGMKIEALV